MRPLGQEGRDVDARQDVQVETRYAEVPPDLGATIARPGADSPAPDGGWVAGPVPVEEGARPRAASTVMVVRDVDRDADGDEETDDARPDEDGTEHDAVEVFMLRRRASMEFAPNRMVFPGGGVDERDADDDLPWAGPAPQQWAQWLAADEAEARELVVAAAREVFEECGVLLAGPDEQTLVGDVSGEEWEAERDRLLSREQSFAEMLIRRGFVLRTDLLRPWAHWVTPVFEPRRYDTRFFAARLPEGQTPDDRTSEADTADWFRPRALLAEVAHGRASMMPPTVVCLEQIAAATGAEEFLESAPPMLRVMPVLERTESGELRLRIDLPLPGDRP